MAWYDMFIPPEIQAGRKIAAGDYSGALEAELGLPGTFARKSYEGQQEQRQGYTDAIASLQKLGADQKAFQMEGLNKAEGYYAPAMEMTKSIYGTPDRLRK